MMTLLWPRKSNIKKKEMITYNINYDASNIYINYENCIKILNTTNEKKWSHPQISSRVLNNTKIFVNCPFHTISNWSINKYHESNTWVLLKIENRGFSSKKKKIEVKKVKVFITLCTD